MPKYLLYVVAGISLALSSGASADGAEPTLGERVGYASSLAGNAAHGDKKSLAELQKNAVTDPAAEFGLGEYYYFTRDYPQSLAWLKKSADHGFSGGDYGLGKAYEFGIGVPVDYAQAMHLYLQATALPDAETHIGDLYARGKGVNEDDAQAEAWYRKAARGGSIMADIRLGYMYVMGIRVKRDYQQALQWYRKAAEVGNVTAEYSVGQIYEHAGSLQDYKQAAAWYQKASQQGMADAQLRLGELYLKGQGVLMDPGKAVQQFQMAANQGDRQAQCRLAQSFADGKGVPPDPFRAYQWFALTQVLWPLDQSEACAIAPERMAQLAKQLGPAQTARARQAAEAWSNKYRSRGSKQDDLPPF